MMMGWKINGSRRFELGWTLLLLTLSLSLLLSRVISVLHWRSSHGFTRGSIESKVDVSSFWRLREFFYKFYNFYFCRDRRIESTTRTTKDTALAQILPTFRFILEIDREGDRREMQIEMSRMFSLLKGVREAEEQVGEDGNFLFWSGGRTKGL